jgi:muramoyltetrapeptide carboxypeptidase LdcA involved in peptidoglycan recycling
MKIVVPIVASYPDKRGVLRNAKLCRERGHEVQLDPALWHRGKSSDRDSHGTPEQRARNLMKLLFNGRSSRQPVIVATATGGYGSVRTLYRVPMNAFRNTVTVGFSDSTAVAIKAALESDYPSFHGPCFEDREFMEALCYYTLQMNEWETPLTFADRWSGKVEGTIWGGNLTIFNYLAKDLLYEFRPKFFDRKAILFLEDVYDKGTYSKVDVGALIEMEFDRLEYSGILNNTVAVILGRFPRVRQSTLLESLRKFWKGPVAGIDVGHAYGSRDWNLMPPIPLGVRTTLSLKSGKLACKWENRTQ